MRNLNDYQDAVIGAAVGDSIGFITEKFPILKTNKFIENYKLNKTYYPSSRTYPKIFNFGQYSDDTQFSRLLIESLIEKKGFDSKDYLFRLVKIFNNKEIVGIGKSTSILLEAYSKNEPIESLNKNSSNGSVMRSYPLGLFYDNEEEILRFSKDQSILTHDTEEAIMACQLIALSMNHLKNNSLDSLIDFWKQNNLFGFDWRFLNYPLNLAQKHIHNLSPSPDWEFVTPSAKATVAAVYYTVFKNRETSFEEAILTAISLGGDTDSVASIVGAIIGFTKGDIPLEWQNAIEDNGCFKKDYLLKLAKELFETKIKMRIDD